MEHADSDRNEAALIFPDQRLLLTCATIATKAKMMHWKASLMDIFNDLPQEDFDNEEEGTNGSDELLSHDNLRLPEDANPLVRVHAVRAWLTRRQQETEREIGTAALQLQGLQQEGEHEGRLRRRELQARQERLQEAQREFSAAQQRLQTYEEATELLEDCVNHTTISERLLVEYYLALEDLLRDTLSEERAQSNTSPRQQVLTDVLGRIEHVGAPNEEE